MYLLFGYADDEPLASLNSPLFPKPRYTVCILKLLSPFDSFSGVKYLTCCKIWPQCLAKQNPYETTLQDALNQRRFSLIESKARN